jgi:hypothetical protein
MNDFENSIVTPRTLQDLLNSKDLNDSFHKSSSSINNRAHNNKDSYLTLTFRTELNELSFKNVMDKYGFLEPCICRKMDFPEIIMPDDFRNDVYVHVLSGDFQKTRNYEFVTNLVQFREEGSKIVEVPVYFEDEKKVFFYKSIVYLKQEKPRWNEIVNVKNAF